MDNLFGYYAVFSLWVYIFGVGFLFTFLPAVIYINNHRTLCFLANMEQKPSKLELIYFWWLFIRCVFLFIPLSSVFYMLNYIGFVFPLFYILLPLTVVMWFLNYLGQTKINIILRKKLNEQEGDLGYEDTPPQNGKKLNAIFKLSHNKLFRITVYIILFFTAPMILFFFIFLFAMGTWFMTDLLKEFFAIKTEAPESLIECISFLAVLIAFITGFIAPLIQYKENLSFSKTLDRILNKKS